MVLGEQLRICSFLFGRVVCFSFLFGCWPLVTFAGLCLWIKGVLCSFELQIFAFTCGVVCLMPVIWMCWGVWGGWGLVNVGCCLLMCLTLRVRWLWLISCCVFGVVGSCFGLSNCLWVFLCWLGCYWREDCAFDLEPLGHLFCVFCWRVTCLRVLLTGIYCWVHAWVVNLWGCGCLFGVFWLCFWACRLNSLHVLLV